MIRPFTGNGKLTIIVDPDFVPAEFTLCCAASQGKGEVEAAYFHNFCDLCDEGGWFGVCPSRRGRGSGPWLVKLLPTGLRRRSLGDRHHPLILCAASAGKSLIY